MMISVITPSIREEGLKLVESALYTQTHEDYEWLVGSPKDFGYGIWVEDDFKDGFWSLNRIYNKLIKESKGDLIVSWQDYTHAQPDALERFWTHFQLNDRAFVSGYGHKYEKGVMVWKDPREVSSGFGRVPARYIEFNFCSFPKQALYDIGGFDESLDMLGFGMDGVSVVERAEMLGYEFYMDMGIESFSDTHGRVFGWDEHNLIGKPYNDVSKSYKSSPKLKYLG